MFGAIFDSGCIYWQTSCNRRGNCWVYDNSQLSQRALILAILGIGTNFIFSLFSWLFYPKQFATEPASHKEASPKREMELHDQVVLTGSGEGSGDMKRMSVTRTDSQCSENVLLDSEM